MYFAFVKGLRDAVPYLFLVIRWIILLCGELTLLHLDVRIILLP